MIAKVGFAVLIYKNAFSMYTVLSCLVVPLFLLEKHYKMCLREGTMFARLCTL